jgi:hypothetical protein
MQFWQKNFTKACSRLTQPDKAQKEKLMNEKDEKVKHLNET